MSTVLHENRLGSKIYNYFSDLRCPNAGTKSGSTMKRHCAEIVPLVE